MVVELISVGTELLLGNIVNTNAAYLAEKCAGLGLSCYDQTVVGDNSGRLAGTIRTALERADLVILSGDPTAVEPMSIRQIWVLETIKDGTTVYAR